MRHLPLTLLAAALVGCGGTDAVPVRGGDVDRGRAAIERHGCGGCHTIGGVQEADARIAPSLTDLRDQRYIAGQSVNGVDNLIRWISDPKSVSPNTLMPDLGVSLREARDIAAYLYSDQ